MHPLRGTQHFVPYKEHARGVANTVYVKYSASTVLSALVEHARGE